MVIKRKIKTLIFHTLIRLIPPFQADADMRIGVSSVVCHDRLDMFICSAASLMFHLKKSYPIYIVSDGSLTSKDVLLLKKLFTVIIESEKSREAKYKKLSLQYPHFVKYRLDRLNQVTKLKYDAYLLSPFSKILYMDLDILFLKRPLEIIRWLSIKTTNNYFLTYPRKTVGADLRSDEDYSFRRVLGETLFPLITPSFNSGILCIANKSIINLSQLNTIFAYFNSIGYSRSFMAEETAMAIVFKHPTCHSLSTKYYICAARQNEYEKIHIASARAIHFISETESNYLKLAILQLISTHIYRISPNGSEI